MVGRGNMTSDIRLKLADSKSESKAKANWNGYEMSEPFDSIGSSFKYYAIVFWKLSIYCLISSIKFSFLVFTFWLMVFQKKIIVFS